MWGNFVSRIDQVVDMKYWDLKINNRNQMASAKIKKKLNTHMRKDFKVSYPETLLKVEIFDLQTQEKQKNPMSTE